MHKYKSFIQQEKNRLIQIMNQVESTLENAPEGTLRIISNRGCEQYYHRTDRKESNGKYIRKEQKEFARMLARKEYHKKILAVSKKCLAEIQAFEENYHPEKLIEIYDSLSEPRKRLLEPILVNDEEYVQKWESVPYEGKGFAKDLPEIYTDKGERVRSKSEKMIADKLYQMGIPYRYECPIELKGYGTIYPDFVLLYVAERKEYILEHLGMMDNPEYSIKAIRKINTYAQNGIYVGDRLLLTYETSQDPVDMRLLQKMLQKLFL